MKSITRGQVFSFLQFTPACSEARSGFRLFLLKNNELISSVIIILAGRRGNRKDAAKKIPEKARRNFFHYFSFCRSLILSDFFFHFFKHGLNEQL